MFALKDIPSLTTFLTAYASIAGSIMFARSIINQFIPQQYQSYIISKLHHLFGNIFGLHASHLTMVIKESSNGLSRNQVFEAAQIFLPTKINPSMERLEISKSPRDKSISITLEKNETVVDTFEGIQLTWKYICAEPKLGGAREKRCYELSFLKKHMDKVQESYLPYVLKKSQELKEENKVVKLLTCGEGGVPYYDDGNHVHDLSDGCYWSSVNLEHPSTFDTLAMDPELKTELMEDLDRFVKRREFYKKVGKVWKRGYLLYGPPGTGKSSLIAAMANYLKFDIYDLELANLRFNSSLRSLLASTSNRSILVIEDIDCSVNLKDRQSKVFPRSGGNDPKLTLSGLLNFIDGLWSSCGDERIIIFTTNHKDKLDPALLRPGRMDMHIHMSYCTPNGFRLLAGNYLSIHDHRLFGEIDELLQKSQVTPAEVAEELMKSDNADVSLDGLVKFLKRKKIKGNKVKGDGVKEETTNQELNKQKLEIHKTGEDTMEL